MGQIPGVFPGPGLGASSSLSEALRGNSQPRLDKVAETQMDKKKKKKNTKENTKNIKDPLMGP